MADRETSNEATLKQIYKAFADNDLEVWKSFFDDRSVLIEAESLPYGGRFEGLERILEAMSMIRASWDDFQYDVDEMHVSERSIIVYGQMDAVAAATRTRVQIPLVERWIIVDGIVREVTAIYSDTALMAAALASPL